MKCFFCGIIACLVIGMAVPPVSAQHEGTRPVITPENAAQVRELARFGQGKVNDVAVSPEGKMAAVATDIGVWLYDLTTAEPLNFWGDHTDWVSSVDFSLDGRTLLSGSWDNTLRLWNVQSGAMLRVFEGHTDAVQDGFFTPGGQTILSRSDDGIFRLWDVHTGEILETIHKTFSPMNPGWNVIAPDGQTMLFVPFEGEMRLLDSQTDMTIRVFKGTWGTAASVVFFPDGQTILEGVKDGTLRLWDVQTGELLRVFETEDVGSADCVAVSPDGRLAVSCSRGDNALHVWDIQTGAHLQVFRGHTTWITGVTFTPDDRGVLSSAWNDDALYLWDVQTGEVLQEFKGHSEVWDVAFAPDEHTIAACGQVADAMRLWDIQTGDIRQVFAGNQLSTHTVAFAPDGHTIISGGCDGTAPPWGCNQGDLRLWDVQTGELLRVFEGHQSIVTNVAFAPDGHRVLSGTLLSSDLRLWNVDTGQMIWALDVPSQVFAFAPDGQTIITGGFALEHTLYLIDVSTGAILRTFEGHEDHIAGLAFAPDGQTILSGSEDGEWRWWDVHTGEVLQISADHWGVSNITYAPNGELVLSNGVYLWDAHTGELLQELEGHRREVRGAAFSPDGTLIVSGSTDGTIRLWGVP